MGCCANAVDRNVFDRVYIYNFFLKFLTTVIFKTLVNVGAFVTFIQFTMCVTCVIFVAFVELVKFYNLCSKEKLG